jgi:hypothetical protein
MVLGRLRNPLLLRNLPSTVIDFEVAAFKAIQIVLLE